MHAIPNCRFRNYFQLHEIHSRSCSLGFELRLKCAESRTTRRRYSKGALVSRVGGALLVTHISMCTPFLQLSTDSSLYSTRPTMSSQNPWKALKTPNWHVITTSEIGKKLNERRRNSNISLYLELPLFLLLVQLHGSCHQIMLWTGRLLAGSNNPSPPFFSLLRTDEQRVYKTCETHHTCLIGFSLPSMS